MKSNENMRVEATIRSKTKHMPMSDYILEHRRDVVVNALRDNRHDVIDAIVQHVTTDDQRVFILAECFDAHNFKYTHDLINSTIARLCPSMQNIKDALAVMCKKNLSSHQSLWPGVRNTYMKSEELINEDSLLCWELLDVSRTSMFRGIPLKNMDIDGMVKFVMRNIGPESKFTHDMPPLVRLVFKVVYNYISSKYDIIDHESVIDQVLFSGDMGLITLVNTMYRQIMRCTTRGFKCRDPMNVLLHSHVSRLHRHSIVDIVHSLVLTKRYDLAIYIADISDNKNVLFTVMHVIRDTQFRLVDWGYTLKNPLSNNVKISIMRKCADPAYGSLWSHISHVDNLHKNDVPLLSLPRDTATRSYLFNKRPCIHECLIPTLTAHELAQVSRIEMEMTDVTTIDRALIPKIMDEHARDVMSAAVQSCKRNGNMIILDTDAVSQYKLDDLATVNVDRRLMCTLVSKSKNIKQACYDITHYKFMPYSSLTITTAQMIAASRISLTVSDAGPYLYHDVQLLLTLTQYMHMNDIMQLLGDCTVDILMLKSLCSLLRMI